MKRTKPKKKLKTRDGSVPSDVGQDDADGNHMDGSQEAVALDVDQVPRANVVTQSCVRDTHAASAATDTSVPDAIVVPSVFLPHELPANARSPFGSLQQLSQSSAQALGQLDHLAIAPVPAQFGGDAFSPPSNQLLLAQMLAGSGGRGLTGYGEIPTAPQSASLLHSHLGLDPFQLAPSLSLPQTIQGLSNPGMDLAIIHALLQQRQGLSTNGQTNQNLETQNADYLLFGGRGVSNIGGFSQPQPLRNFSVVPSSSSRPTEHSSNQISHAEELAALLRMQALGYDTELRREQLARL